MSLAVSREPPRALEALEHGQTAVLRLAELQARDRLVATLDCTGGLYSRQRCSGLRFARLLERAGPQPARARCA